jgi:hypothetical protein
MGPCLAIVSARSASARAMVVRFLLSGTQLRVLITSHASVRDLFVSFNKRPRVYQANAANRRSARAFQDASRTRSRRQSRRFLDSLPGDLLAAPALEHRPPGRSRSLDCPVLSGGISMWRRAHRRTRFDRRLPPVLSRSRTVFRLARATRSPAHGRPVPAEDARLRGCRAPRSSCSNSAERCTVSSVTCLARISASTRSGGVQLRTSTGTAARCRG